MWKVKRTNRVVSLSSTAILLMAQRFCHPLMKENRGGFGSGRSQVLRKIGCCVHPVPNPFPGLPAVPSLVPHTELALGTEASQGLCSALSRLGAGAGIPSHRAAGMGHSVQLSTPTLRSAQVFFLAAGLKITVTPASGCLKRPLALWWSYCKVALLINSNYKLIQQYECGCKQVLQLLKCLFMSKIMLDKMHAR